MGHQGLCGLRQLASSACQLFVEISVRLDRISLSLRGLKGAFLGFIRS